MSFFLPVFWYRLILIAAIKECVSRSSLAFLDVPKSIWPCLHLVVNPLYFLLWSLLLIVDLDRDTATPGECSSLGCCERLFLYHLRGRSLWTFHVFLCCWAHWCVIVFLNVPNCWFGHSECSLLSLTDGFVLFWSLTIVCFTCWRDLTAWCGFTATASKCKRHTWNQLQTFYLLNWCRYNKGIARICPWNSFWVNYPFTYSLL